MNIILSLFIMGGSIELVTRDARRKIMARVVMALCALFLASTTLAGYEDAVQGWADQGWIVDGAYHRWGAWFSYPGIVTEGEGNVSENHIADAIEATIAVVKIVFAQLRPSDFTYYTNTYVHASASHCPTEYWILYYQTGVRCVGVKATYLAYISFNLNYPDGTVVPMLGNASAEERTYLIDRPRPSAYKIRIEPATGNAESDSILTRVEPGKQVPLVARVYDGNGQLASGVGVSITIEPVPNRAGHHSHSTAQPPGDLIANNQTHAPTLTGTTLADGFPFSFKAPRTAGDFNLIASCTGGTQCAAEGANTVWVGYQGLGELQPFGAFKLTDADGVIGATPHHPKNHYLTAPAIEQIAELAYFYKVVSHPFREPLHINDGGLERGGILDIRNDWKSPHFEHCRGNVVDIRANGRHGALNITSKNDDNIKDFQDIANEVGAEALFDVPKDGNGVPQWEQRHFHVRLIAGENVACP